MYKSRLEVVRKIIEQFKDKRYIGVRASGALTYSHKNSLSTVGCGIGCLLSNDMAEELQKLAETSGSYQIDGLYLLHQKEDNELLKSMFDGVFKDIDIDCLKYIQVKHDNYKDLGVDGFLASMRQYERELLDDEPETSVRLNY
jgi:hypothetical protein